MPVRIEGHAWAIRVQFDSIADEELFKIPNTVCVYHIGTKTEKPHYHLYYNSGDAVTTQRVVQNMLKANPIVAKHYSPSKNFWAVTTKPSYTLKSYWEYVWRDYPRKKQRLIWWDIAEEQLPIPEPREIIEHVTLNTSTSTPTTSKKSTLDKQNKFLKYCKDYYELYPGKVPTNLKVLKLLYEYCSENGHTTQTAAYTYVNYAMSHLVTGSERKEHRRQFATRLERIFFSG